ncbi:hypothetical protein [Schleiferilactobacillus harbinensis]|uniref:Uncharacterized protein n=1 Tax=Schleiferilactobacillus harbinensis TaxID=304207 RepID=A0ABU7SZH9_9LACO
MRRTEVEKAAQYVLTHPTKVDAFLKTRQDYIPWKVDFTQKEWDYFDELMIRASKELTEWPEPVIM